MHFSENTLEVLQDRNYNNDFISIANERELERIEMKLNNWPSKIYVQPPVESVQSQRNAMEVENESSHFAPSVRSINSNGEHFLFGPLPIVRIDSQSFLISSILRLSIYEPQNDFSSQSSDVNSFARTTASSQSNFRND